MKLRYRILSTLGAVLALGFVSLAVAISYDRPCSEPAAGDMQAERVRGVVHRCYGSSEVLRIENIEKPRPKDDQVLIRVHASSVNPVDWYRMTGRPYVMRLGGGFGSPPEPGIGVDYAGTIVQVGKNVTRFKPGDEVFGGRQGALAEYIVARADGAIAHKPANISFEQAAGVAVAAITALQALRDQAQLKPGQKVLINGASGGVGTFAVQIAKALGAHVTGVCSSRNVDLVRSIGADEVIDYTRENFTEREVQYDAIIDNVGNHPISAYRRVLKDDGVLVTVGGSKDNAWLGPITRVLRIKAAAPFVEEKLVFFVSNLNQRDFEYLAQLMRDGKVTPVVDRTYPFEQVQAAMDHLESGRARGKVIVTIASDVPPVAAQVNRAIPTL